MPVDPDLLIAAAACFGGWFAGSFFGLVLHEGAHALAAACVGLEPRAIVIGRGRIVWRRRFRRTWLVVRAWPIYGFAARLGDPRGRRGAQAFVVAAGPAASLILCSAALLGVALSLRVDSLVFGEACLGIAVAAGTHLGSMWPTTFRVKGVVGLHATDGWKLVRLAQGKDVDQFQVRYARLLGTVLDESEMATPPSILAPELVYQVTRPDKLESWARADAAQVLVQLLDDPVLGEAERLYIVKRYKLDRLDEAVA